MLTLAFETPPFGYLCTKQQNYGKQARSKSACG
jgi:hypothetical protein